MKTAKIHIDNGTLIVDYKCPINYKHCYENIDIHFSDNYITIVADKIKYINVFDYEEFKSILENKTAKDLRDYLVLDLIDGQISSTDKSYFEFVEADYLEQYTSNTKLTKKIGLFKKVTETISTTETRIKPGICKLKERELFKITTSKFIIIE